MTDKYRLMIHFAVATFHFYRKDIIKLKENETLGVFHKNNIKIIERVCDEAKSLFNYELSHEQIGKAIGVYVAPAQSVEETQVAKRA